MGVVASRQDVIEAPISYFPLLDAHLMHSNENNVPVSFLGDHFEKTSVVESSLSTSHGISILGYVWG